VDGMQGREKEVIIISLREVGFLKEKRRMNGSRYDSGETSPLHRWRFFNCFDPVETGVESRVYQPLDHEHLICSHPHTTFLERADS